MRAHWMFAAGAVEREPTFLWSRLGLMEAYRGSAQYADAINIQRQFADQLGVALDDASASSPEAFVCADLLRDR